MSLSEGSDCRVPTEDVAEATSYISDCLSRLSTPHALARPLEIDRRSL